MRVLLLSQFYPPVAGGVEVHVAALAEGLAKRGHEVVVGTLDGGNGSPASAVRVARLESSIGRVDMLFTTDRRHAPPVPDPGIADGIRHLVASFSPDIVHAHNWIGRSFLPIARRSGARSVITLHDCGRICAQGRRMYRGEEYCEQEGPVRCFSCCAEYFGPAKGAATAAGNRLMRGRELAVTDLYLPVSRAVAEANRLEAARARYEVVPNFVVDPPSTRRHYPELDALPSEPFILQVGDVVADKGVHVLLEAYRRLHSPPPLVLVGRIEPHLRDALPPGVLAPGVWGHDVVVEAWHRSLFGTMPSLCLDACPTSAMEAMAASRPVVASSRGGLLDQVVDGVTGLLVTPGSVDELARAMDALIGDGDRRAAMGRAARERFDALFRSDVVIGRIEALYRSLVV